MFCFQKNNKKPNRYANLFRKFDLWERGIEMLEKQNKYSIRKLTVGAASVLIGASFFAVNGKTVEADTVNNTNNIDVT